MRTSGSATAAAIGTSMSWSPVGPSIPAARRALTDAPEGGSPRPVAPPEKAPRARSSDRLTWSVPASASTTMSVTLGHLQGGGDMGEDIGEGVVLHGRRHGRDGQDAARCDRPPLLDRDAERVLPAGDEHPDGRLRRQDGRRLVDELEVVE